ncbi:MAG: long-chain fatty acid--CoA ligase [Alicyclobacillus sp.]|nr:long-chain fatty acid--CoA ligase [Alicyclobacillus sp.]
MMHYPLLMKSILYRANTLYPNQEIVSRDYDGLFRYTYRDLHRRVCQLANALAALGVQPGTNVASFAWNNHRHLELYFGVPCAGRVLHTVNIRLFPEQIVYTINHAEDQVLFVDPDLLPAIEQLLPHLTTVKTVVALCARDQLPAHHIPNLVVYEELLAAQSDVYEFPEFDEYTPAIIAYTSATTGNPKGVVYTHRGLYLHCLVGLTSELGIRDTDVTMPIVPMFHVNAWGRPFIATWAGAKQVYPGARPTPQVFCELIEGERVTMSAGVPTIWMGILHEYRTKPGGYDFSSIRALLSGGAALPLALVKAFDEIGVNIYQGYGQTETTPVTFIGYPKASERNLPKAEELRYRVKTGLLLPGLEMRLVDMDGKDVPFDGQTMGELWLRGPWVIESYYKSPEQTAEAFVDGWFRTGDIAVMDPDGYLQITDRTKDLIKSGGEWISSVDLENAIMGHPDVAEAAVIGVPHPKWQERPLACVLLRPEAVGRVSAEDIRQYLEDKVAKWWIPDQIAFVEEIPKTSVGKFSKRTLRELFDQGKISAS